MPLSPMSKLFYKFLPPYIVTPLLLQTPIMFVLLMSTLIGYLPQKPLKPMLWYQALTFECDYKPFGDRWWC